MRLPSFLLISSVLLLTAAGCSHRITLNHVEARQYIFTDSTYNSIDTSVSNFISPYHDSLQQIMNQPLAYSLLPLTKAQPESTLGDFTADACFTIAINRYRKMLQPQPDFLMLNQGGLRSALPKGTITLGNIYELMPFENELVMLKVSGSLTAKLLDYIAARGGNPVAGLRMRIADKKASDVFIHGQAFDMTQDYYVVMSDYMANGGDNMDFITEAKERYASGIKVRDAITEYLKSFTAKGDTLKPATDGRIIN